MNYEIINFFINQLNEKFNISQDSHLPLDLPLDLNFEWVMKSVGEGSS